MAIPVSLIGALGFAFIFGFSLNSLTLFGLILATGLVVDDAISAIADDESLTGEEREEGLQETFATWLSTGESFKVKAEQVARYIRHQEALPSTSE